MAKLNKTQADLIKRLSKLKGRQLAEISRHTSIFSYQRGYTKHGLTNLIKQTKNRNTLQALKGVVELYEQYGTQTAVTDLLDSIYSTTDENIQKFIRIMRSKEGWSDTDILIVLENNHDIILYMESEDMMRMDDREVFGDFVRGLYDEF